MTIDEFLRRLKRAKNLKWRVHDSEAIRCARGRCPIEAVANVRAGNYYEAALKLGLSVHRRNAIMDAADTCSKSRLRSRLLNATVRK